MKLFRKPSKPASNAAKCGDTAAENLPAPANLGEATESGESGESGDSGGAAKPAEFGGRKGPDPTRYGDWENKGRCVDF